MKLQTGRKQLICFLVLWHLKHKSATMQLKFVTLAFCFLGTVILCGAQTEIDPTADATTQELPTTVIPNTPDPTVPTVDPTAAPNTDSTENTGTPGQTTLSPTIQTEETGITATDATAPPPTESAGNEGLSSGAIAGIAVGSIAGVAAVGGGIFGALKYTGRI
ncbi:uncharacterized protein LOC113170488 isoform X1 [Anabas testudineus]|uniref:uncharacterized protein LOC113170488 isoform X1 n=2 Tax=Anabas testudineus TaxID=64144 RepID=UPI000E4579BA|nr:uncharacterized protein LOC113170488 isoform X1 [Anabas testudineus]